MSWIRDRLGLKDTNTQSEEDKYGIRARLGISKSASTNQNVDNLSSQRNIAAEKLMASRKKYQDYIQEETKEARSQKVSPLSSKPTYDLAARRNEMEQLAVKNAQATEKAKSTEKAKELKQDIKQKQNEYNYANYLVNAQEVENMNVSGLQKAINPFTSATRDFLNLDKLNPEESFYYDDYGNKSYLPSKKTLKQQKIRQESTGAVGVYSDIAYNMTKAVESKLIDSVAPGAGTMLYYGDIVTDSVEEAKKQGYNNAEALAYGAGVGIVAGTLDNFIGTFGGLSNVNENIPSLTKGLDSVFANITKSKVASTILSNMSSEYISEYTEEFVDNALKYFINSDQSDYNSFIDMLSKTLPDAMYAGLIGGLSGGIGGTIENITGNTEIQERKKAIEQYTRTLENYKPESPILAAYKEEELTKADDALEQLNTKTEELQEQQEVKEQSKQEAKTEEIASKEELTSEVAPKEETTSEKEEIAKPVEKEEQQEVKEPTYKTAKYVESYPEEGLTTYRDVDIEERRDVYGRERADNTKLTTTDLNNAGIDLITYHQDENGQTKADVYEFDSKKDLDKYIKSIGGYSQLGTQYTLQSNLKNGEFYYVRDKFAKGGWKWTDVNGDNVKGYEKRQYRWEKDQIKAEAKKVNITPAQTNKIIETTETIERVQTNETPVENYASNDINYTKDGIQTTFNEKVADDVIRINEPNEKPQTVTLTDGKEEVKVKKPSAELSEQGLEEVIKKYNENLSEDEKAIIKKEIKQKHRDFENAKQLAIETKNKPMLEFLNKIEEQEIYNQIDVSSNVFKEMLKAAEDIDDYTEKFNISYLDDTIGSSDETPTNVNYDTIAKGQAILFYQIQNNDMEAAMDALVKVKRYGTTASQALNQMKAMYQNTEFGIYLEAQNAMDDAYQSMAKRKTQAWRDKNNPMKNPNSKFKFTEEENKIIAKKSAELYKLHETDHEAYCAEKGKLQQAIGDRIPQAAGQQITNWVRSALLLSTRTVIKNAGSNVIDTSYHALNKANYTVADKVINKYFGSDIRVAGISVDGIREGQKAYFKTSAETARIAFNNLIHKTSVSTEYSSKYETGETSRDNVTKDFFNTMPARYQTKFKLLNETGNVLSQLSHDALSWGDAKFQAQSYADNKITLRLKNAYNQFNRTGKNVIYDFNTDEAGTTHISYIGDDGKYSYAITNSLDEFLEQNDNFKMLERMKDIDALALKYSESRTYVGDTTFSKSTSDFLAAIDRNLNKLPVIRGLGIRPTNFIVPFSKIGSNLCYKMYRGSILSIPSINKAISQFKTELADGKVSYKTQYEVVSRVGDLMTGTMVYLLIGGLSKAAFDNMEGDDDDDEASKVSKFMKSVFGKEKYSFKIGDYNVSFDVGGNLTNMLKMGLDLKKLGEKEDKDAKDYIDVALGDMLSEWTVNNLTEVLNTEYNDTILSNILQTTARIPSMAIPNFMKDFAMTIDNFNERTVWDEDLGTYAINSIKAKIPFARSTLDAKTDSWGNTMKVGDNLITQVWNTYIVGNQIKKDNSDPVSQELMQQYLITNDASLLPNTNKNYFSYNNTKYNLTSEEEQQYLQTYAKTAHDNLDKLFYSTQYQNSDTETKQKYIAEIYEYANDEAKKEYLNNNNISYYNYGRKIIISGTNDTYKQAQILDAIDNNISYEAAKQYQNNSKTFKYYESFGSYETYDAISSNVDDIQKTYSSKNGYSTAQRKQKVVEYVNSLNGLSDVQKAILIKQSYPSLYKSYNEKIKAYLKNQNLDEETYNKLLKDLGITK